MIHLGEVSTFGGNFILSWTEVNWSHRLYIIKNEWKMTMNLWTATWITLWNNGNNSISGYAWHTITGTSDAVTRPNKTTNTRTVDSSYTVHIKKCNKLLIHKTDDSANAEACQCRLKSNDAKNNNSNEEKNLIEEKKKHQHQHNSSIVTFINNKT